jgi:plastocyanin/copper chaperone CopZ
MAIYGLQRGGGGADEVKRTLANVHGVVRAYVNPSTEMAYVEYDAELGDPDVLLAAVEHSGYKAGEVLIRSSLGRRAAPSDAIANEPSLNDLPEDHSCCEPALAGQPGNERASEVAGSSGGHIKGGTLLRADFKYRLAGFTLIVALVLGTALWLIALSAHAGGDAQYTVDMSMAGFNPSTLVVPAGKPITIRINNVDSPFHGITNGALHQFAIDELGINVKIDARESRIITLPAMSPGSYHFYCDVCCGGKVNAAMQGEFIIRDEGSMSQ